MRLNGAIRVQHRLVPDVNQIEFAHVGRLHIDTPPDLRPEQAKIPAQERRPGQRVHQERLRQMLVEGADQLIAPDAGAPKRFLAGPVAPNQNPLGDDAHHSRHQRATCVKKRKEPQVLQFVFDGALLIVIEQQQRGEQQADENDEAGRRREHAEELNRRPSARAISSWDGTWFRRKSPRSFAVAGGKWRANPATRCPPATRPPDWPAARKGSR